MNDNSKATTDQHDLTGLDGANPLGFLAALGVLRALTHELTKERIHLRWQRSAGCWRPSITFESRFARSDLLEAMHNALRDFDRLFPEPFLAQAENAGPKNKKGEPKWRNRLRFTPKVYREFCEAALREASIHSRHRVDSVAAWATEMVQETVDKEAVCRRTSFDFTAGNQAIVNMMRLLTQSISTQDLDEALFHNWHYESGATSLRWDPLDESRQYALQAFDPTDGTMNPVTAVAGANCLAIYAMPFFPIACSGNHASQPGFTRISGRRVWSWPIWSVGLTPDVIQSLLTHRELTEQLPDSETLAALGVEVVFRCGIVQPSGRYRCFTRATAV